MNADGSSPQQIPIVATNFGPAWSPDGQRSRFSGHPGVSHCRTSTGVRLDGTGFQQLTGCDPDNPDYGAGLYPAWSPTGQRIAYQAYGIVVDDGDESARESGPGDRARDRLR